jgi:hypothetical protein
MYAPPSVCIIEGLTFNSSGSRIRRYLPSVTLFGLSDLTLRYEAAWDHIRRGLVRLANIRFLMISFPEFQKLALE